MHVCNVVASRRNVFIRYVGYCGSFDMHIHMFKLKKKNNKNNNLQCVYIIYCEQI